jgi:tRNA(fMet)-specific endonuclease VapC
MILLDTDHLSVLTDSRHALRPKLLARLETLSEPFGVPLVAVEEMLRGWLAEIHRVRDPHKQIVPYLSLAKLLDFIIQWRIVVWNEPAADAITRLRQARIRIGTQDLKIAAIALAYNATLLSANLRDFEKVPNLRVEDWLHT